MGTILDVLLLTTCWAHVLLAPYTKVEESFNLHATHDVLMYGVHKDALPHYDHFVFPGAVPRTFIGSVLLAWISMPVIHAANYFELLSSKFDLQTTIRLVLATVNALTLSLLRRGVSRRFGGLASVFFTLLTCTQFHLPFWVGRTLPNMFALIPVNLAFYSVLNRAPNALRPTGFGIRRAIALLTFTAVVFRSEVALLLGPLVLQSLVLRYISFGSVLKVGFFAGSLSLALTVLTDSYFWDHRLLWPEFYGVYFNVILGKSFEWGVSHWSTYLTSYLPKLLLSSLPLSLIGYFVDSRVQSILFSPIAFVFLLSALGHKEWRFIVYVVPLFNIAAARGASWMISRRKGTLLGRLCFLIVAGLLAGNCLMTSLLTRTSMANYPGGEALTRFNELYAGQSNVHVHISNLAAQTGASLFLQVYSPPYPRDLGISYPQFGRWTYNKTENLSAESIMASQDITHVIAECISEDTTNADTLTGFSTKQWDIVDVIHGYQTWRLDRNVGKSIEGLLRIGDVLKMVKTPKLAILERRK